MGGGGGYEHIGNIGGGGDRGMNKFKKLGVGVGEGCFGCFS